MLHLPTHILLQNFKQIYNLLTFFNAKNVDYHPLDNQLGLTASERETLSNIPKGKDWDKHFVNVMLVMVFGKQRLLSDTLPNEKKIVLQEAKEIKIIKGKSA